MNRGKHNQYKHALLSFLRVASITQVCPHKKKKKNTTNQEKKIYIVSQEQKKNNTRAIFLTPFLWLMQKEMKKVVLEASKEEGEKQRSRARAFLQLDSPAYAPDPPLCAARAGLFLTFYFLTSQIFASRLGNRSIHRHQISRFPIRRWGL